MSALLRLYPPAWRERYGEEMDWLLGSRPIGLGDRLDLARGAMDAWLHPPGPSRAPAVAAVLGGGVWTVVATTLMLQPAPPDWPYHLIETLPLALAAALALMVASVGCSLRLGDASGRMGRATVPITIGSYVSWMVLLGVELISGAPLPLLAVTQTIAMAATLLVGARLLLVGDEPVGSLLVVGAVAMLIPWTIGWLVLGAAWTAVGVTLWMERATRVGPAGPA